MGVPYTSDLVAWVEIAIAALLIVGWALVRGGHVRAHMYVQSSMVFVNVPIVLTWMVPQYLYNVLPGLPAEITVPYYWIPTVMLVAGGAAEALGIFIVLVAATNLVPSRLRFRDYKRWMRTELVLWWSVVVFGLLTFYIWYLNPIGGS